MIERRVDKYQPKCDTENREMMLIQFKHWRMAGIYETRIPEESLEHTWYVQSKIGLVKSYRRADRRSVEARQKYYIITQRVVIASVARVSN